MLILNKSQYENLIRNFADAAAYELQTESAQFWLNPETLETKIVHVDKGTSFPPFTKSGWIELYASEKNRISLDEMLRSALKRNNIAVEA